MRIDVFELECTFRQQFTLAEVLNGRANVFQLFQIRNVRGSEHSWLHLCLELDGKSIHQKSVRGLSIGDDEKAASFERGVLQDMVLQPQTPVGPHTLRLLITGENASTEQLASISILPPDVIPTDFLRADLLSAYVQLNDSLRSIAAEAVGHLPSPLPAAAAPRCLYDVLLAFKPFYQPVSGRQYPDCQRLSSMESILQHGGSCADLSMLFASLMWNIDVPPALLLFENHMAAGCFPDGLPDFETLNDPAQILQLVQCGTLLPWEATSVCHLFQHQFDIAQNEILQRIRLCARKQNPCMLINVQRILMQGMKPVPQELCRRMCPLCGYVAEVSLSDDAARCPACRKLLPSLPLPPATPAPEPVIYSDEVVYCREAGHATATRLKTDAQDLRLMDVWQGLQVTKIGERAFFKSSIRSVALPDSLAEIGDYAFASCKALEQFRFSASVSKIGTGAFRDSGLRSVCIPNSLRLIPRTAFAGCESLESLTLSDGIQQIDDKAFDGCTMLHSVTIPSSVKQFYKNAFPATCRVILMSNATKIL